MRIITYMNDIELMEQRNCSTTNINLGGRIEYKDYMDAISIYILFFVDGSLENKRSI